MLGAHILITMVVICGFGVVLKEIVSLWVGPPPSYLEHVVIKSYLAAGHPMTVFSDRPVDEFPTGVTIKSPLDILPELPVPHPDAGHKAAAVYSDIFRLLMLARMDAIWVDMDAYCVTAFNFDQPNVFGHGNTPIIPNGIVGFAQGSPVPMFLADQMMHPNPVPEWLSDKVRAKVQLMQDQGQDWGMVDLPWGVSGPRALTYALRKFDLIQYAHPQAVFYSTLDAPNWQELFQRTDARKTLLTATTKSVHFFAEVRKILVKYPGKNPYVNGYIAEICAHHDVRPADAPIVMTTVYS